MIVRRIKEVRDGLLKASLRRVEKSLPVDQLYRVVQPMAFLRAAMRAAFCKAPQAIPLPGCFRGMQTFQPRRLERMDHYLNFSVLHFADRLATPKWRARCHFVGLDRIEAALKNKRPVVLAATHFGPFYFMQYWLRAANVPIAAFVGGNARNSRKRRQVFDERSPFPKLRIRFYQDELREAVEFLRAGNVLLLAIDRQGSQQITVPVRDGWTFEMNTAAIRLAMRHNADLIPYCFVDEGHWRFRIELGQPVPREYLQSEETMKLAGAYLIEQMLPHFEAHPGQCPKHLLDLFKPTG